MDQTALTFPIISTLDFLVFSVIIFLAVRSCRMTAGLRIRTLLETLAKDSTWYFIVIFTSHIAFEATLIFGRVSAIVPYSVAVFPNVRPFRKQSSSFRACKLLSTCLHNNRPHHVVRRHNQRQCLVSPAFGAHMLFKQPTACPRFIPVMISRIVISLRKATDLQQNGWSFGEAAGEHMNVNLSSLRWGTNRDDDVPVGTHPDM